MSRIAEIVEVLQGGRGPAPQRAVRLGELLEAGIVQLLPNGALRFVGDNESGGAGVASVLGTPGRIVVDSGTGAAVVDLAPVTPVTGGALLGLVIDAFGRVSATRAVVPGTNIAIDIVGDDIVISATAPGTGNYDLIYPAAGTVNGLRAVVQDPVGEVRHPVLADAGDAPLLLGIATNSALVTDDVVVRRRGVIVEAGWSWTPGPVYVEDGGVLTQTAPSSGWILQVAVAINATTVEVDPQPPIYL